jgi:hypothetical protein
VKRRLKGGLHLGRLRSLAAGDIDRSDAKTRAGMGSTVDSAHCTLTGNQLDGSVDVELGR